MISSLHAIHLRGVQPDSLGGYLTGLGILSACSKEWPDIRGCWREARFVLLHQNGDPGKIRDFLLTNWVPPKYPTAPNGKRLWLQQQKSDTKEGATTAVRNFRANCALNDIDFLDSHLVSTTRNVFNPVFGSGGNIGKRDLAKVTQDAHDLLSKTTKDQWLDHTLFGTEARLPTLQSTGTWFVFANKTYNSGQDGFWREGRLSPWSFLLALEGALLLRGGIGRRLSAKSKPHAVFPFVTDVAQPLNENEIGLKRKGEFWAPLWEVPSTVVELRALLRRGLARIGRRAAIAPYEFGVAVLGEGVDTGVGAFVRFELRETTSGQTFEAIPHHSIKVHRENRDHNAADLIGKLVPWIRQLPDEPNNTKKSGKFVGLRGPIEDAIRLVTEEPENPTMWQSLLLRLAEIQHRAGLDQTY